MSNYPAAPASNAGSQGANGQSTVRDIFLLSDEQILEVLPEPASAGRPEDVEVAEGAPSSLPGSIEQAATLPASVADAASQPSATGNSAAAPAPFSNPEDVRALAELYPGGITQAKSSAERARLLDDIDRAYFGAHGSTPEQTRSARAQLAATMLREDPVAFREMVFEGLRALEAADGRSPARSIGDTLSPAVGARLASPAANRAYTSAGGASPSPTAAVAQPFLAVSEPTATVGAQHAAPQLDNASANQAHLAAYAEFEKAANADLEKSVGGAIDRALQQALPNVGTRFNASPGGGAHDAAPLQARLSQAIRQDVEKALQGDRQLGEQIAQILAGRRFNAETRAQVVRLINDRAQQLVPVAAKRALNDWTQATLAAHRSSSARAEASSARREVPTAAPVPRNLQANARSEAARSSANGGHSHSASRGRVDYRKLSDDQILDL